MLARLGSLQFWTVFRCVFKISKSNSWPSHVCLSICMEKLGSYWMDILEIWCTIIFQKSVEKIQVHLSWTRITGALREPNINFWSYRAQFLLEWEMFQTELVEKIKTHILCSLTIYIFLNCAINEIMWKNIVELESPQMTIWRMCISCWVLKATCCWNM